MRYALHALLALAVALTWSPCIAQDEDGEGEAAYEVEEVAFDMSGGQVLPGGAASTGTSTFISSQLTYTWGEWYLLRMDDNLFVQSEATDARFHLCVNERWYMEERARFPLGGWSHHNAHSPRPSPPPLSSLPPQRGGLQWLVLL